MAKRNKVVTFYLTGLNVRTFWKAKFVTIFLIYELHDSNEADPNCYPFEFKAPFAQFLPYSLTSVYAQPVGTIPEILSWSGL